MPHQYRWDFTSVCMNIKVFIDSIQNARISRQNAAPTKNFGKEQEKLRWILIEVGVACSHDFYAALLNRIAPIPRTKANNFKASL